MDFIANRVAMLTDQTAALNSDGVLMFETACISVYVFQRSS